MEAPTCFVRQLDATDRDHVVELYTGLSEHDRFNRFHQAMPRYPAGVLDALAAFDGSDHVAFGAFVDGHCVAIAHYIRHAARPSCAELAVVVADGHRRQGLARRLVGALVSPALGNGIETFEVNVQPQNGAAAALVRSLAFRLRYEDRELMGTRPVAA